MNIPSATGRSLPLKDVLSIPKESLLLNARKSFLCSFNPARAKQIALFHKIGLQTFDYSNRNHLAKHSGSHCGHRSWPLPSATLIPRHLTPCSYPVLSLHLTLLSPRPPPWPLHGTPIWMTGFWSYHSGLNSSVLSSENLSHLPSWDRITLMTLFLQMPDSLHCINRHFKNRTHNSLKLPGVIESDFISSCVLTTFKPCSSLSCSTSGQAGKKA